MTLRITSVTDVMMAGPPWAPTTRRGRSLRSTMVGDMAERGRLPGSMALFSLCKRP